MLRFINLKETFNLFPSFKKKKKLDSLRYKISRIVSLNLALIKKKKKHETTRPFLGRGLKRGHLLCQVSHQKVKQPASRELGELKIATCQVKHRTTTTRHVHVPKRGNWYVGTGFHRGGFEGWFEGSWLLAHARCPCM